MPIHFTKKESSTERDLLGLIFKLFMLFGAVIVAATLASQYFEWDIRGAVSKGFSLITGKKIQPDLVRPEDISDSDFEELLATYKKGPEEQSWIAAVGPTNYFKLPPHFYITGNVPNDVVLTLTIEAEPNGILFRPTFVTELKVQLQEGFVKTAKVNIGAFSMFPKGHYILTLTATPTAGAGPVRLVNKKVFLGGADDEDFKSQLAAYRLAFRARTVDELIVLRQFLATVEVLFQQLMSKDESNKARSKSVAKKGSGPSTENQFEKVAKMISESVFVQRSGGEEHANISAKLKGLLGSLEQMRDQKKRPQDLGQKGQPEASEGHLRPQDVIAELENIKLQLNKGEAEIQ